MKFSLQAKRILASLLSLSLTAQPALAQMKFRVPLDPVGVQSTGSLAFNTATSVFGAVPIGTTVQRSVELTNTGESSSTVDAIELAGEGFFQTNTCASFLAAGAKCKVTVNFRPDAKKSYLGTLTVKGDAGKSVATVDLSGSGEAGSLSLTPQAVTFDTALQLGSAATPQYVTVRNTGQSRVTGILVSAVNGTGSADFTQSNNCGAALAPNESCSISVGFTPMASGERSGVLAVASDASNGIQQVPLAGRGVAPSATLQGLNLGSVQVGMVKTGSAVFQNTGIGSLTLEAIGTSAGAFGVQSHNCPDTLSAGQSCNLTVQFAPASAGAASAQLAVRTTEAGVVVSALTGSGQEAGASLSTPTFADTLVAQDSTADATLSNTGIDSISVSSVAAASVTGTGFSFVSTTCGATLAAGASCAVKLKFAPQSMGAKTGLLTVNTSAGARTAALSALATEVKFQVSPASVDFGDVSVGQSRTSDNLTVTNTGNLPVQGLAVSSSGAFALAAQGCPATLAVNASCTFTLKFSPTAAQPYAGSAQVGATNTTVTRSVSMSGAGIQGDLGLSATSLNFPATQMGQTASAMAVSLTNQGLSTLTVGTPTVSGDFSITSNGCSAPLAPAQSCQVAVAFTPTNLSNPRTGTLTLPNDGQSGVKTVSLSGSASAQQASLSAPSFSSIAAGTTATANAILSNTGVGPLSVTVPTAASVTGAGFSLESTTCGTSLAVGASCTVSIRFQPSANQDYTGSVTVETGAGSKSASFSATGTRAVLTLSPATLGGFGNVQVGQTKDSAQLTVTNSGNATATSLAITPPSGYSLQSSTCGASLAAGAACTFVVRFAPSSAQAFTGNVSVSATTPAVGSSVAVSGTGVAASATLSALSFGNVAVGSSANQTSTLQNTGVGPLSLTVPTSASVSGTGFAFSSTTCGASLAAGATCNVTVSYTPTVNQAQTGTLTVQSGAGPLSAQLNGTGTGPTVAQDVGSFGFSSVQVGQTKTSATRTLTNSGNAAATGLSISVPAGFSLTGSTCGTSLAAGASCSYAVVFAPTAAQAYAGDVTIAFGNHASLTFSLGSAQGVNQSATLAAMSFGSRAAGSSTDIATTLTNTGVGPLSVAVPTSASVTGAGFSFVSTTCGTSVAAGGTCAVTVRFGPSANTAYTGNLTVSTGAGSLVSALTGSGLQGTGSASSTNLTFGSVQVNQTSAAQAVTLTNNGGQPLTFSGISVAVGASDFGQSNNCGATLSVGASCTVNVAFTPSTTGVRSGTLVALHDGPGGRTDITLGGTGVAQSATISTISFGNVLVGSSGQLGATISNTGVGPVTITTPTAASVSGTGFSYFSTTCGASLAAGASCLVTVNYTPSTQGASTGTLTVSTSAGSLVSNLSGTGLQAVLSLSTSTVNFGNVQIGQTADSAAITLSNTGNTTATSVSVFSGLPKFTIQSNTCGATLAAGASCSFAIRFAPDSASTPGGTVVISSLAPTVTSNVTVSGTGVYQSGTLSDVAFGNVAVNSTSNLTSTLTNTGSGPLSVTAPTAASVTGAGFSFVSTTCGTSLAVGATCTVTMSFAPTSGVAYSGSLSVSTGAGSKSSSLSGTGTRAVLSLAPNVMPTFGNVQVGQTADSTSITLSNTGSATATSMTLTPGTGYSLINNTCGTSLAAGASCTFAIRFAPAAVQSYTTGLTVAAAAPAVGTSFAGTGTGVAQTATLSNVDYGAVNSGTTSTKVSTLTNTGVGPLSVTVPTAASISDGSNFSFVSTTCGTSLNAGSTCTVTVTFNASGAGVRTAFLSVSTGAGTKNATLTGVSNAAYLSFGSTIPGFGNVQVGQTATSGTVTLTNNGNVGASSLTLTPPAAYTVTSSTCGTTLAAGASCSFAVQFSPPAAQNYTGLLRATAAAPAFEGTVALNGTGVAQAASLSAIAYGSRAVAASTDLTSTLTNSGVGPLSITAPTAGSVTGTGFSYVSTTCGASLAAGGTCTVTVRFTPTDTVSYSGTLSVTTGAGARSASLSGTGQGSKATATTSTTLALGSVAFGAAAPAALVTYRNDGNTDMTLTPSAPASPFSVLANNCTNIAAAGTCYIYYSMATSNPGSFSASSTVSGATVGGGPVSLSGTVTGSKASATTSTSMTFTTAAYNATQPTSTLTLRNDGNTAMTLTVSLTNTTNFVVNSNGCSTIAAGATCNIVFAMRTTAIGAFTSNVTISGASTGSVTATLGGTVTGVATTWASTSLAFGTVAVGSSSALSISITNNGNVTGNLQALLNLPTGFTSSGCTAVAAGASCSLSITFAPTSAVAYSGSNIYPSAANIANNTLSVSGNGASGTFTFSPTISADTQNYNLRAAAVAAGWNGTSPLNATVTINSGVVVSANSTGAYAFDTGASFPAGSTLKLTNNGFIIGMGGAGGRGAGTDGNAANGGAGGPALRAQAAFTVTNNGTIGGGGGGGGGGATDEMYAAGSGGGGGRSGRTNSAGGVGGKAYSVGGVGGGVGTFSAAGVGGPETYEMGGYDIGGYGGNGGGWGQAGQTGGLGDGAGPGLGGAAGAAVVGNANVTWSAVGTRAGALQ